MKQVIQANLSPSHLKEMSKSDNKGVAVFEVNNFYYNFKIIEREKTFEIGQISINKEDLSLLGQSEKGHRVVDNPDLCKLITLISNAHEYSNYKPESFKEPARHLVGLSQQLVTELKIHNYSYQSLLQEALPSIEERASFKNEKELRADSGFSHS